MRLKCVKSHQLRPVVTAHLLLKEDTKLHLEQQLQNFLIRVFVPVIRP